MNHQNIRYKLLPKEETNWKFETWPFTLYQTRSTILNHCVRTLQKYCKWLAIFILSWTLIKVTSVWIVFFYFQILILEPSRVYMPSYVTVNNSQDEQSVQVFNVCIKCLKFKHKTSTDKCKQDHSWLFSAKHIKTITLYKRDERCIFFYVQSDDFQMYFPSEAWRQRFYEMVSWIYGVLCIYLGYTT